MEGLRIEVSLKDGYHAYLQKSQPTKITQSVLENNSAPISDFLHNVIQNAATDLSTSTILNPPPLDKPCCDRFEDWARNTVVDGADFCPHCGEPISHERRKAFGLGN